jgi:hypothetical protein
MAICCGGRAIEGGAQELGRDRKMKPLGTKFFLITLET